jgi:PAS domain S-box-containing protein
MSADLVSAPSPDERDNRTHSGVAGADARTPYSAVVSASLDPVITMDDQGRVIEFNPAAERVFGYRRADVVGREMAELVIPPRLRDAHRRGLARYLATGQGPVLGQRLELTAMRADGREFPVELAIVRLPDVGPPMFTGFIRDLSRERSAEEALRALAEANAGARADAERSREELYTQYSLIESVLASTDDLVFAKDADGRYVLMNEAGARLHGLPVSEIVGRTDAEIFPQALATELRANDLEVMRSGEVRRFEESTIKDGESRIYLSTKNVYRGPEGAVAGVVGVSTDITERKRIEAERGALLEREQEARVVAERANAAKSDFLAVMSHELRTPLNAITGYTQLLEMGIHGPVTDQQRDALGRIARSQRHLLALINDILNFVRIEVGRVHYHLADVELGPLIADVAPLIEPQLMTKALHFETHRPESPVTVRADADKLRQVLLNLLSNAIKFTPTGGAITVDIAQQPHLADRVFLRVTDTGPGIPRDKLELIFEPFVRVETSLTRTTEGAGLGLAISRDLARGMGGDLRARSVEGKGSTFTLTLRRVATIASA